jgi:hypothetical protein
MLDDPVVKETRDARERLVADFDGDLNKLWEHLQRVQERYGDRVVRGTPKPPVITPRKAS